MLAGVTLVLILLASIARGYPTESRSSSGRKFVQLPVSRDTAPTQVLQRRLASAPLTNTIRTYLVEVTVDSQSYNLAVDTGSAETWVKANPESVKIAHSQTELDDFRLSYVDGSSVHGHFVNDSLAIGDTVIENATFAIATSSNTNSHGFLGLGLEPVSSNGERRPTILDSMIARGLIKSRSYSIQLNSKSAERGSIVFGGYDAVTYASIATMKMWSDGSKQERIAIEWNGLSLKDASGRVIYSQLNMSRPVMLDTGFTLSTLPDDVFDKVADNFDIRKSGGNYYIPCQQPNGSVEFSLGGVSGLGQIQIAVPYSELAIPANLQFGGDHDQDLCMFGFQPVSAWSASGSDMLSFGDTFLRSAYLVINLDEMTVGMAQTDGRSVDCKGCIIEI